MELWQGSALLMEQHTPVKVFTDYQKKQMELGRGGVVKRLEKSEMQE